MTGFQRGVLYWARLDKRRPVLVVSSNIIHRSWSYLSVVPGSTRLRPLPTHVRLARGEGGLRTATMLLCEHVQTIAKADVEAHPIGSSLSPERMHEVETALLLLFDMRL